MRRQLLVVYGTAALSFAAGLLRDWLIVNRVGNFGELFGVMYSVSLASSFVVNAATFRPDGVNSHRRELALIGASTAFCAAIVWGSGIRNLELLLLCLPIPLLYILGAAASRRMFDRGLLFWGRFRDGLTSTVMAGLIWVGMGTPSLLVATFAICALYFLSARQMKPVTAARTPAQRATEPSATWSSMFYSNLAIALFTAWALLANNHAGPAFGHPGSVVVRFSAYFFQVLCIPAVLVVRMDVPAAWAARLRRSVCLGVPMLGLAAISPLEVASIGTPIAALFTLYASVAYMRATHDAQVATP